MEASMNYSPSRVLNVGDIQLPDDIEERRKSDRVRDLAASIKASGLIQLPVIDEDRNMVAGRDRIAALLELGHQMVEVRTAHGSPDELKMAELAENIHRRRDNIDELRAEYVTTLERILKAQKAPPAPDAPPPLGRPRTARGEAVDMVAAASGVTPNAVRRSLAKLAEEEAGDPAESIEQAADLPPPVETWGVPVEHLAQEFAEIRIVQAAMDEAARATKAALAAVKALKDGGKLSSWAFLKVAPALSNAAEDTRYWRPTYLCAYCKGLVHRRSACTGCAGVGYLGNTAVEGIAQELQRRGEDALVTGPKGTFMTLEQARTPAKAPAKEIELTDQDIAASDEDIPF